MIVYIVISKTVLILRRVLLGACPLHMIGSGPAKSLAGLLKTIGGFLNAAPCRCSCLGRESHKRYSEWSSGYNRAQRQAKHDWWYALFASPVDLGASDECLHMIGRTRAQSYLQAADARRQAKFGARPSIYGAASKIHLRCANQEHYLAFMPTSRNALGYTAG